MLNKGLIAKYIFVSVLILTSFDITQSQDRKLDSVYVAVNLGVGSHVGFDITTTIKVGRIFRMGLGYSYHIREAQSRPEDYEKGIINRLFAFGLVLSPYDFVSSYHAVLGRIIPISEKLSINLEGVVGYSRVKQPENWQFRGEVGFADNYSFENIKYDLVHVGLRPKLEFQPIDRLYLTIGPQIIYTKEQLMVTGQLGLLFRVF